MASRGRTDSSSGRSCDSSCNRSNLACGIFHSGYFGEKSLEVNPRGLWQLPIVPIKTEVEDLETRPKRPKKPAYGTMPTRIDKEIHHPPEEEIYPGQNTCQGTTQHHQPANRYHNSLPPPP